MRQTPEQIHFFCRPNAIARALTNLVENGIHYGGEVEVTGFADDRSHAIEAFVSRPTVH